MPHAEYPSASACLCEAFSEGMKIFTGTDDFNSSIGSDLFISRSAFSSNVEPLSTPAQDLVLSYSSWTDISEKCGQSRLDGGMHFTASVPAGKSLCTGIGEKVINALLALKNGTVPEYVVDPDDTDIPFRDC